MKGKLFDPDGVLRTQRELDETMCEGGGRCVCDARGRRWVAKSAECVFYGLRSEREGEADVVRALLEVLVATEQTRGGDQDVSGLKDPRGPVLLEGKPAAFDEGDGDVFCCFGFVVAVDAVRRMIEPLDRQRRALEDGCDTIHGCFGKGSKKLQEGLLLWINYLKQRCGPFGGLSLRVSGPQFC